MRIDLHTHSNVSDGTDTPTELVEAAQLAGLDVVALTDHDTFEGIAEATAAGGRLGVEVIVGIELSATYRKHPVHLLGYGCDPSSPELAAELAKIRASRRDRIGLTCQRLNQAGVSITLADVATAAGSASSIGRPHVADALIKLGHVADRKEAFRRYLSPGAPGYVPRYATPLEHGIKLLAEAGGATVLAHPWGRGGEQVLTPEVLASLKDAHGLDGIEVWHQDHDDEARRQLGRVAATVGLIPTGASDYHGTGKVNHPLGVNLTPPKSLERLREKISSRSG